MEGGTGRWGRGLQRNSALLTVNCFETGFAPLVVVWS